MRTSIYSFALLACVFMAGSGLAQQANLQLSVYFEPGSADLSVLEQHKLEVLADTLHQCYHTYRVEIEGNTDDMGKQSENLHLAKNRCQNVQQYLEGENLVFEDIVNRIYGESRPIAANVDEKGRQNNRRVDVRVYFIKSTDNRNAPTVAEEAPINMDLEMQVFVIRPHVDTMIIGRQGTVIFIPAHTFRVRKDKPEGRDDSSLVHLHLYEIYKKSDFALANMGTVTDKGELLESGGTILLKAFRKGRLVEGELDRDIITMFPTSNYIPNMDLYAGLYNAQKNIDWALTDRKLTRNQMNVYYQEYNNEGAYWDDSWKNTMTRREHRYELDKDGNRKKPKGRAAKNRDYKMSEKDRKSQIFNATIEDLIQLGGQLNQCKIPKCGFWCQFGEVFMKPSNRTQARFAACQERLDAYLQTLAKRDSAFYREYMRLQEEFGDADAMIKFGQILQDRQADVVKQGIQNRDVDASNLSFYIARINNISITAWNCDQPYTEPLTDFTLALEQNDTTSQKGNYMMILKDRNAAVNGRLADGGITFGLVPKNENAHLVHIRQEKNKIYVGIRPIRTNSKRIDAIRDYIEVDSQAALVKVLEVLN